MNLFYFICDLDTQWAARRAQDERDGADNEAMEERFAKQKRGEHVDPIPNPFQLPDVDINKKYLD